MGKFRYQHITSSVKDKVPQSDFLYTGEIAVNIYPGFEKLYFKNASGDVVSVLTEEQVLDNNYFMDAEYESSAKTIYFYNSADEVVATIDATDFIKDGMVDNVEIKKIEVSGETISVLAITFNTDAGKEEIDIPLTDIFDPNNYYTKDEITWSAGTGNHSTVLKGGNNTASGNYSVAEGYATSATNFDAHAEGGNTLASGMDSHAEGTWTQAIGNQSHAEGTGSTASGFASHAEGSSYANGVSSHAEGSSTANGDNAHAEGTSFADGNQAHAEGDNSHAVGLNSHTEGFRTSALTLSSHAEGSVTVASGSAAHSEGVRTHANESASHAEGEDTKANGIYSHVEGKGTVTSNQAEHASGHFNKSLKETDSFGASGNTLFSVGNGYRYPGEESSGISHNAFEIRQNGDIYIADMSSDANFWQKPMVKLEFVTPAEYDEDKAIIAAAISDINEKKLSKAEFEEEEAIIAAALNDLNENKLSKSEYDADEAIVAAALNDLNDNKLNKSEFDAEEAIVAAALNDLNDKFDGIRLKKISQSDYDDLVNAGEVDANTLYIII